MIFGPENVSQNPDNTNLDFTKPPQSEQPLKEKGDKKESDYNWDDQASLKRLDKRSEKGKGSDKLAA